MNALNDETEFEAEFETHFSESLRNLAEKTGPSESFLRRLGDVMTLLGQAGDLPDESVLVYQDDQDQVRWRALGSGLVVGRNPKADLSFSVPIVSWSHFAIRQRGAEFEIEDLQSSNGTWVNDRRISRVEVLKSGDMIQAGDRVFVFKAAEREPMIGTSPVGKEDNQP